MVSGCRSFAISVSMSWIYCLALSFVKVADVSHVLQKELGSFESAGVLLMTLQVHEM